MLRVVAIDAGWQQRTRASWRRAVGWLLLGLLLVTLIGVPLPQRKRLAGDTPFPCQDHPCGCSTAEACWQNCCCFSDREKLAWARERGVTPPPHVVRAAFAAVNSVNSAHSVKSAHSVNSGHSPSSTAASGREAATCGDSRIAVRPRPSCCSAAGGECEAEEASETEEASEASDSFEAGATVVLLEAYRQCRGLRSIFEQLTENWTPPAAPQLRVEASLLYCVAAFDERPIDQPRMPEPPVP